MKTTGRALGAIILAALFFPAAASAQVVISVGIQEIYDDNIFLENDNGTPPPVVIDDQLADPTVDVTPPKEVNGDPDDDFITNPYVAFSGNPMISPHWKTAMEGKVGALIFGENSDETRMTVDTIFTIDSEKSILPDPYYAGSKVAIQSRSADITAAEGTATQQAQTLLADIHLGLRDIQLATDTKMGLGYLGTYNDFLGDFTFSNRDEEELGPYEDRVELNGSDYFTNGLDFTVDNDITEKWKAGLYTGFTVFTFTSVDTSDLEDDKDEDDSDRTEFVGGLRSTYQVSEQVSIGGSAGFNQSHLQNKPDDTFITILNPDGTTTQLATEGEQDDTSFVFGANVNYAPDTASLLRLAIDQSRRTDIDGDRIITRTVTLDGSKAIGDRWRLAGGGRFLQFNIGDSLENPTDRFEVTLSAQYNLTESLALTAGWNYVNQDADDSNLEENLLFSSEDYEGNRFFIGLSMGLVGSKT